MKDLRKLVEQQGEALLARLTDYEINGLIAASLFGWTCQVRDGKDRWLDWRKYPTVLPEYCSEEASAYEVITWAGLQAWRVSFRHHPGGKVDVIVNTLDEEHYVRRHDAVGHRGIRRALCECVLELDALLN